MAFMPLTGLVLTSLKFYFPSSRFILVFYGYLRDIVEFKKLDALFLFKCCYTKFKTMDEKVRLGKHA